MTDSPNKMPTYALLIVDMQEDYLSAPELKPPRREVIEATTRLLEAARNASILVTHVHTQVDADGANAMPHRASSPRCVVGTAGANPPIELNPHPSETVLTKRFFSAFGADALDALLERHGVSDIVLAGAYTHACIRETALDAYSRGYTVHVVGDAICSDQPNHAGMTLEWLGTRAATVISSQDATRLFDSATKVTGQSDLETICPLDRTLDAMVLAQHDWAKRSLDDRIEVLHRWITVLEYEASALVSLLVDEIHKPVSLARDEVSRAIEQIRTALHPHVLAGLEDEEITPQVRVVRRPLGLVAAIMPWNNPVALPVGNIAPALLAGNAAAFKASPLAPRVSQALLRTLEAADVPKDLVTLFEGGGRVGMQLVRHPLINAVSVTGSLETGQKIASACAVHFKALRAELGGNNAAIVLADAPLDEVVPELLRNAFSYAGQRCTAIRRFVVHRDIAEDFIERARHELALLPVGSAQKSDTVCGPLISIDAADRVSAQISTGLSQGATLVAGGELIVIDGRATIRPTLLVADQPENILVQRETFGPVAVIQIADSLDHAVALANGVEQGLVQSVCTLDDAAFNEICNRAEVGIVQRGGTALPVHPAAPFVGWKASGVGGPEHGRWDYEFFTRPQTRYGSTHSEI